MTAPSYRLDSICAALIERLEGARRTWSADPDDARAGLSRIASEQLERILAEHDELIGTPGWAETVRAEVTGTFLPRYLRLAVDHNDLEERGYDAWRKGDPIARILGALVAMLGATAAVRLIHHPAALVAFAVVLAVPFIPEIRRFHFRRRYRGLLQEVIDDMGRIQDELDRYPASDGSVRAASDEAPVAPARAAEPAEADAPTDAGAGSRPHPKPHPKPERQP